MVGLFALFMLGEWAMAQKVAVSDVEAVPGETVSFSLSLSEGRADSYTALKFDVQFPAEGFTTTGAYSVSSAWPGASAVIGDVDGTGLASMPFASASEIAGSEVDDLLTVSFKVGENVAVGNYDVTLKNIVFEYGGMEALKDNVEDVTFQVLVVDRHNVVLNENSTEAPSAAENVNVCVKRTIKANEWSTLCLPFAMTEEQVEAAFGDDVQLAEFTGWETTAFNSNDDPTGITVTFDDVSAIEANTPYIIKVSSPVSEFTVDGVDINPDDEPAVTVGKTNKGTFGSFTGSYVPMLIDEECLFLSENKFWYSMGKTNMKGYRAYFYFQDVLAAYYEVSPARIGMVFTDETETGISEIRAKRHGENNRYYNLKGQLVDNPSNGLYIKNGKKIVFK